MVADKLAAAHVPVLTGAMNNIPERFRDARPATGKRRHCCSKAGVAVALIGNAGGGDEEAFNVRNLQATKRATLSLTE